MDNRTDKQEGLSGELSRTKPAEVRKDELMSAAERLFLAKGIEATTISEIVEDAQVAKGTFYNYFSSKGDLFAALSDRYLSQFLVRLQEAVNTCPSDDWQARLRAWVQACIEDYVQTYRTHDIVYSNHHRDRANPAKDAVLAPLMAIIEGGQAAGVWRAQQPRIAALLIYAGVHGAADDLIAAQSKDYRLFAQSVADSCLRLLG